MYKSFSEYAVRQEVNEFDGKFSNLCETIYFSDLDFDEYWTEHALPILLEGNHSSSDELLDKLLDEQGAITRRLGRGAGHVANWFSDKWKKGKERWKAGKQAYQQARSGEETGDKWNSETGQWEKSPEPAPAPAGGGGSSDPVNLGGPEAPEVTAPAPLGATPPPLPAANPELDHAVTGVKKQFSQSLRGLVNSMKGQALKAGSQHGVAIASSLLNKMQDALKSFSGRDVSPEALKQAGANVGVAQEKQAERQKLQQAPGPDSGPDLQARLKAHKAQKAAGKVIPMPGQSNMPIGYSQIDTSQVAHHKPEGLVVTESLINYAKKHNLC